MKTSVLLCMLTQLSIVGSASANANECNLIIHVKNVANHNSPVMAKLFRKGSDVLGKADYLKKFSKEELLSGTVFSGLPCGEYAAVVFVDEDLDGTISHGVLGPNEPIGFSGSYKMSLFSGFPTFQKLKFLVAQPQSQISLSMNRSER